MLPDRTSAQDTGHSEGLGRRRRTYRQQRKTPAPLLGFAAGAASGLVVLAYAGPAVAVLTWAVLVPLGVVLGAVYNRFAPIPGPHGRLLLTVYDNGVVIRHDHGETIVKSPELIAGNGEPPDAKSPDLKLLWSAPMSAGRKEAVSLDGFGAGRSLRKSLAEEAWPRPRRLRTLAYTGLGLAAAAAAALGLWVILPLSPSVPEKPEHLAEFCSDPDMVFEEAPPYEGSGPHYVEEWVDGPDDEFWIRRHDEDADAVRDRGWSTEMAEASLIACGDLREGEQLRECSYTDGPLGYGAPTSVVPLRAMEYEFTIYEAATHEYVGEVTVAVEPGDDVSCPPYLREGDGVIEEFPSETRLVEDLAPFVENDAED